LEILFEAAFEFAAEFFGALVCAESRRCLIHQSSKTLCWPPLDTCS
jgi:hypothetical protein